MTATLPATFVEAEALAVARELVAQALAGVFMGVGPPLAAETGRMAVRAIMRNWALLSVFNMDLLVALAGEWEEANIAATELAAEETRA